MKKFEIIVTTKRGTRKVNVSVDSQTVAMLENCTAEVRQTYLEEEYKAQMQERAETRRHISLETSIANGHDFESPTGTPLDELLKSEESGYIKILLDKLTVKQYKVFTLFVFEGISLHKIAEKMGLSVPTVHEIYHAAIKKLKKFLETP